MRRVPAGLECVDECVRVLRGGGLVCVPTETVYGLIGLPGQADTLARLTALKGRPAGKPFALFTSSWERLTREPVRPSPAAERLADIFWPGPLTLVIAADSGCPAAHAGTVGARCPDHPLVQGVLAGCGGLLINTSLNRSGEPAVWSLEAMEEWLLGVDLVVDGGTLPRRPASTVVDCTMNPPRILRAGGISESALRKVLDDPASESPAGGKGEQDPPDMI